MWEPHTLTPTCCFSPRPRGYHPRRIPRRLLSLRPQPQREFLTNAVIGFPPLRGRSRVAFRRQERTPPAAHGRPPPNRPAPSGPGGGALWNVMALRRVKVQPRPPPRAVSSACAAAARGPGRAPSAPPPACECCRAGRHGERGRHEAVRHPGRPSRRQRERAEEGTGASRPAGGARARGLRGRGGLNRAEARWRRGRSRLG